MSLLGRLYRSEFHVEFVGRRKLWYALSAFLIAVSIGSMAIRGFSVGIDFSGGALFQFPAHGKPTAQVEATLDSVGIAPSSAVIQRLGAADELRVQTPTLSEEQTTALQNAVADRFGLARDDVAVSTVGASWGSTITAKALQGLAVFLVLVMLYLAFRFEWKMALAAMAALIHDLVITMGVYSLVGFEVTPSTIIALLTILGFSLYDTVVVFDRVRENTTGMGTASRRTYAEATNDALNETLVRSLNTSLIALIPVASLLFVGAGLLGAGTLKDLALAQFVGIASGTYSSLFFATPLLVDLKKNDPAVRALEARVARTRASASRKSEAASEASIVASASERGAERRTPPGSESARVAGPAAGVEARPPGAPGRLRKVGSPAGGTRGAGGAGGAGGSPDTGPPDTGPPGTDTRAHDGDDHVTEEPVDDTAGLAPAGAGARSAQPRRGPSGGARAGARKNTRRGRPSGRKRR